MTQKTGQIGSKAFEAKTVRGIEIHPGTVTAPASRPAKQP